MAQQALADRGLIRNTAVERIRLGGTDNFIFLRRIAALLADGDLRADMHHLVVEFAFIEHPHVFQLCFDFGNTPLDNRLLIFRLVVLTVFRQVSERKRNLDLFRNLFALYGFQFFQFTFKAF